MQKSGLGLLCAQQHKAIVFDRHIPEIGVRIASDAWKIAQKPACQVDQMDTLIHQLTATRKRRISPPLAVIANPPAVTVSPTNKHHLAQCAGNKQFVSL